MAPAIADMLIAPLPSCQLLLCPMQRDASSTDFMTTPEPCQVQQASAAVSATRLIRTACTQRPVLTWGACQTAWGCWQPGRAVWRCVGASDLPRGWFQGFSEPGPGWGGQRGGCSTGTPACGPLQGSGLARGAAGGGAGWWGVVGPGSGGLGAVEGRGEGVGGTRGRPGGLGGMLEVPPAGARATWGG